MTVVTTGAQQRPEIGSTMAVATLPRIATVDARYQSYNVEMAEVIGGNFWKPYDQRQAATERVPQVKGKDGEVAHAPLLPRRQRAGILTILQFATDT
jgi:hypothetical protein